MQEHKEMKPMDVNALIQSDTGEFKKYFEKTFNTENYYFLLDAYDLRNTDTIPEFKDKLISIRNSYILIHSDSQLNLSSRSYNEIISACDKFIKLASDEDLNDSLTQDLQEMKQALEVVIKLIEKAAGETLRNLEMDIEERSREVADNQGKAPPEVVVAPAPEFSYCCNLF